MISGIVTLLLIGILSTLAFWRPNAVLFAIVAGLSMMLGLNAPDTFSANTSTTTTDITIALSLIAYALVCIAFAFRVLFWSETEGGDE